MISIIFLSERIALSAIATEHIVIIDGISKNAKLKFPCGQSLIASSIKKNKNDSTAVSSPI